MPTPSDNASVLTAASAIAEEEPIAHATCPPEVVRQTTIYSVASEERQQQNGIAELATTTTTTEEDTQGSGDAAPFAIEESSPKTKNRDEDAFMTTTLSPESSPLEAKEDQSSSPTGSATSSVVSSTSASSSLNYDFSNVRLLPNYTSSFLRSGSRFEGTQQSDSQVYYVDVEIKHVDMAESYLCGYLRIKGKFSLFFCFFFGPETRLPTIIGTKHTFQTKNDTWGANEKTDMQHWARFPAWRPLAKQAKKANFTYRNFAQREHLFMRWKEYFLVPDHRVRQITGASFEGFYYICFNQVEGTISGIYFHAKSEKYQQLELKHVQDRGCAPAIEFR
ncbi:uncharacterized protein TRUGW13939_03076 [Talaromyces rugulosus]|uniref:Vesicle-mediated transport protein Vid24 n=1 Tax=Talaromyces rugulosus TaxID=121627 RepID=A0A7H8QPU2_TALRU|nr:uncharacterized protein TRUGW13939_03076 [Talaromyces rugulosus]QKX55977.1 hypothetical protein TRUGW13939_03076 [Talaromyces rugulosus]